LTGVFRAAGAGLAGFADGVAGAFKGAAAGAFAEGVCGFCGGCLAVAFCGGCGLAGAVGRGGAAFEPLPAAFDGAIVFEGVVLVVVAAFLAGAGGGDFFAVGLVVGFFEPREEEADGVVLAGAAFRTGAFSAAARCGFGRAD
jgi:hypothetical protein